MNEWEKETIRILETAVAALREHGDEFDADQIERILDRARSDFTPQSERLAREACHASH